MAGACDLSVCGLCGMDTVNSFLSVNELLLTSLDKYFSTTILIGSILCGSLLYSFLKRGNGNFTRESPSERILKIG